MNKMYQMLDQKHIVSVKAVESVVETRMDKHNLEY